MRSENVLAKRGKAVIEIASEDIINICVIIELIPRSLYLLEGNVFRTVMNPVFKGLGIPVINSHNFVDHLNQILLEPMK